MVSIHAPAWGATKHPDGVKSGACFNPRARVGRDFRGRSLMRVVEVSIHAPAWGATTSSAGKTGNLSFNPRARVGRDPAIRQAGDGQ